MHIEWIRRKLKSGINGDANHLVALLVDSSVKGVRIRDGLQAELGSIKAQYLQTKARNAREFHQGLFWAAVDRKLDLFAFSPEVRKGIEQQLLKEVPRPDNDWALWGVTCIPHYDA